MHDDKLSHAVNMAMFYHRNQQDKSGVPYTEHLLRVMCTVPESCRVVAILHDIIEDQGEYVSYESIKKEIPGISDDEIKALELLTRDPDKDTHNEYIKRIAKDKTKAGYIAYFVKVADLQDNMRPERKIAGREGASMMKRYNKALAILFDKDES